MRLAQFEQRQARGLPGQQNLKNADIWCSLLGLMKLVRPLLASWLPHPHCAFLEPQGNGAPLAWIARNSFRIWHIKFISFVTTCVLHPKAPLLCLTPKPAKPKLANLSHASEQRARMPPLEPYPQNSACLTHWTTQTAQEECITKTSKAHTSVRTQK